MFQATHFKGVPTLVKKNWRTQVFFGGPQILLFRIYGFQNQGGSLACMLSHLPEMDFSDSTMVRHLLTSWACNRAFSDARNYRHVHRHWWGSNPGISHLQIYFSVLGFVLHRCELPTPRIDGGGVSYITGYHGSVCLQNH